MVFRMPCLYKHLVRLVEVTSQTQVYLLVQLEELRVKGSPKSQVQLYQKKKKSQVQR